MGYLGRRERASQRRESPTLSEAAESSVRGKMEVTSGFSIVKVTGILDKGSFPGQLGYKSLNGVGQEKMGREELEKVKTFTSFEEYCCQEEQRNRVVTGGQSMGQDKFF